MGKPVVAIVGRPNVGKSMLFNKLIGKRMSIVEDTPGVTRDRLYADCEWSGRTFTLVDTGGIEPRTDSEILMFMRDQAEIAIANADVIVFITDLKTGVTASDHEVAAMLLRSHKPVILAVNKSDSVGEPPAEFYEFYNLGMGEPIAISAVHGHGTGELLDRCIELFPDSDEELPVDDSIKVALIGKPNVGKSSLTNKILGEERVIVSDMAGTTRDAVDSSFENEYGKYVFIDTAGIRKKSKIDDDIEKFSVLRASLAVERSDVCLIMIDAQEGVTEQDTKVAGIAHDAGKACIIVVNKWDLVEKDDKTLKKEEDKIRKDLAYMTYAPILFISAKTGQRVGKLFELINSVYAESCKRITTGMLNNVLADAVARVQPPTDRGKRLKVYYITQTGVCPPNFIMFCNDAKLFHFSYRRYLENKLREVFGFEGTPIRVVIRQKGENG
ncbi:MAG: ribosome biogenesis GTPase Der [Oscillospiraceae bacterium]|nr:ribosome biogenesis GTPase Der [Oscillospiraceae bacterium]